MIKYTFLLSALFTFSFLFGQGKAPANWYLKDPVKDKIYGVGAEEAYKLLTGKKAKINAASAVRFLLQEQK